MLFHDVELELVRPGPPHNQPLNELTQYMALCGENSPITFNVPFEHAELLSRLDHLRYFVESVDGKMVQVGGSIRENTLARLGIEMGALLNEIRSLGTEVASVRPKNWSGGDPAEIAHLRLVLSGSELAILPFELSIAPDAMPGEGQELFLQSRVQLVPTREIRRSRPLSTRLSDFHRPKVLFAYAAPGASVPAVEHLHAIRCSLDPWVGHTEQAGEGDDEERQAQLKKYLRVVPNASLRAISALCEQERFSHVHILAHGDTYREGGQSRWGVALCSDDDPNRKHVVSGKRLAHALSVESGDRNSRSAPFWVTLAACDSGNPGSIMVPGGSIAHELHSAGIPWVLASQFPLTKSGSVEMTRLLYDRLLSGDDPRQALYETRKRLFTHARSNHDWASLVTYASIPPDFDRDVAEFFADVSEAAINRTMRYIDDLFGRMRYDETSEDLRDELDAEIEAEFGKVKDRLDQWEQRIPRSDSAGSRDHLTLFYGITGSVNKRLALRKARAERSEGSTVLQQARNLMMESQAAYKKATDQWAFDTNYYNWVASQYLSTTAVLGLELDPSVLAIFTASTERTMRNHPDPAERAWAAASAAEGKLLDFHVRTSTTDERGRPAEAEREIRPLLEEIINTMGRDSFHVESTRRQFENYVTGFDGLADFNSAVVDLATRLTKILAPPP